MRLLLRLINFPGIVILCALAFGINTSLFERYPLQLLQPDLLPILVIWIASSRTFAEGGSLSLCLGYLYELYAGAPQGIGLLVSLIFFLIYFQFNKVLLLKNTSSKKLSTALGAAAFPFFLIFLTQGLEGQLKIPFLSLAFSVLLKVPIHYLLCTYLFRALDHFDEVTFKQERSEIQASEEFA